MCRVPQSLSAVGSTMYSIGILAALVLALTPDAVNACEPSITTNSPFGENNFTFYDGSIAEINVTFTCTDDPSLGSNTKHWFEWVRNVNNGVKPITLLEVLENYVINISAYNGSYPTVEADGILNGFTANITFSTVNSSLQGENFRYQSNGKALDYADFDIICCPVSELPFTILDVKNGSQYNNSTCNKEVTCKSGSVFLPNNGPYTNNIVTCYPDGNWAEVECVKSCPHPSFSFLAPVPGTKTSGRYRSGGKMRMQCKSGKMFNIENGTSFFSEVEIACTSNEVWADPGVGCWTGPVVSFDSPSILLLSGEDVIFTCKASSNALHARLVIADKTVNGKETAWANVTMTPDHHGTVASCQGIGSFNFTLQKQDTTLNVRYAPELSQTVSSEYDFDIGSTNHVDVKFRANPTLALSDVHITRNGNNLSNFYLDVNGNTHSAVVHFTKVETSDYGNYVVTIKSHPPVASVLRVNFTITGSEAPPLNGFATVGNIMALVLGVTLLGVIIALVVTCVKSKKVSEANISREPKRSEENRPASRPNIPVAYKTGEGENYEDPTITLPPGKTLQAANRANGYVNLQVGTRPQNSYNAGRNMDDPPPPPPPVRPRPAATLPGFRQSYDSFDDDVYE